MKQIVLAITVIALCVLSAQADLIMLEDFESYDLVTETSTIDMKGLTTEYGFDIEVWNAQRNGAARGDHGWSNIVVEDGDQCLQLINRDLPGEVDTVYTCMFLGDDYAIVDKGTIYLRYKADRNTDCIFTTNSLWPGYISDVFGTTFSAGDGYQGTNNYGDMGNMVLLGGGDQDFRAYASGIGAYYYTSPTLASNTWYELWVHVDCVAKTCKYFICEDVGFSCEDVAPPVEVSGPSGDWGVRNTANTSVQSLKWFMGLGDGQQSTVWVDTIAVDPQAYTLERIDDVDNRLWGDANLDGRVNLDDFIILKQHYGQSPADWCDGDFNGDGVVNLDDFIWLRRYYGQSSS